MNHDRKASRTLNPDRRTVLRTIASTGLIGLAGCTGDPGGEGDDSEDERSRGARNLIWATSQVNATYEALSEELVEILEGETDYEIQTENVGEGDGENPYVEIARGFGSGDDTFDFGLIRSDVAYFAFHGTDLEEFEENPVETLRGVATLYPEVVHILTRSDAGIESLEDLEGRTIDVGAPDSPKRVNALRILESVGISGDDFTERNEGVGRVALTGNGVLGGNVDKSVGFAQTDGESLDDDVEAAFVIGGWPSEAVENLLETGDFDLLSLDEETRDEIREENTWFTESTIPADTYDEIEGDVETVSVQAMIATRQEVDEETIGEVTTTIFDNADRIQTKGEFISSATAREGMSITFASGAEESLEEADTEDGGTESGDSNETSRESDGDSQEETTGEGPTDNETTNGDTSDGGTMGDETTGDETTDGETSNGDTSDDQTTGNDGDTGTGTGGDGSGNGDTGGDGVNGNESGGT